VIAKSSVEAWRITPYDEQKVRNNRDLFALDAPDRKSPGYAKAVLEIYGTPTGEPIKYVFVDKGRFRHPPEAPEVTYLPVDISRKEYPLELRMIQYLRPWVAGGAFVTGLIFLGIRRLLGRRKAAPEGPPPAAA